MARIRSIKPEFPQSESMGNVSRDARLTFLQLWTIADDEGRLRGNSRMLASLLFPYDDDAPSLIDTWLAELEKEGCIIRYKSTGQSYIQICNWLIHQKIDKPSKSKIPEFAEDSREFAKPREVSSEDQGRDQGKEGIKDQGADLAPPAVAAAPKFDFAKSLIELGADPKAVADWMKVRKTKKADNTETALAGFLREAQTAKLTVAAAVVLCAEKSWRGLDATWVKPKVNIPPVAHNPAQMSLDAQRAAANEEAKRRIFGNARAVEVIDV